MLYIFCALYSEAKPFVEKYDLARDMTFHHYQVFRNDDVILTVTGTGVLSAAMAVTEVCACIPPVSCDCMLNAGMSGTTDAGIGKGDVFLVNRIVDDVTKKEYFPDMLYDHGLAEKAVCTVTRPGYVEGFLTDMENSGIYAAGEKFFTADRMVFLKVVSDTGDAESVTNEILEMCTYGLLDKTGTMIDDLIERSRGEGEDEELEERIERLAEDMRLSVTMTLGLKQLLRYMCIEGEGVSGLIDRIYRENVLPVTKKNEGKKIYDEIYEAVFAHLR